MERGTGKVSVEGRTKMFPIYWESFLTPLEVMSIMSLTADLVVAAQKRWPEVYNQEWCDWAVSREMPGDQAHAVYEMRRLLLEWARVQCNKCTACPLAENRYKESVWADGDVSSKIFVIGEGPGEYDQRTLIPFTSQNELKSSRCLLECPDFGKCFPHEYMKQGRSLPNKGCTFPKARSGQRIQEPCRNARLSGNLKPPPFHTVAKHLSIVLGKGFWRSSWNSVAKCQGKPITLSRLYFTTVVKCRSCDNGKDKAPLTSNCKACRQWLDIQLALVQPKVVIGLGRCAGIAITGDREFQIKPHHGEFYQIDSETATKLRLPTSVKYVGHSFNPSYIEKGQIDAKAGEAILTEMSVLFAKAYVAVEDC